MPQFTEVLDPIEASVGGFGRWQLMLTILIYLCKVPIAWIQLSMVIFAPPADFKCIDPKLDKCAVDCPKHVFNRSVFTETVISEFDLVCDRVHYFNMSQTIVMFGILIGNLVFGWWSDKWGRQAPLMTGVIMEIITGFIIYFVPSFVWFAIFRFIAAIAIGGTMCTSYVILAEVIGKKWRSTIGILYQIPFFLGHSLLGLIAYLFRDWRNMQLAMTVPSVILVSYFCLLPESPRWCINQGKTAKAIKILERGARWNRMPTVPIKTFVENAPRSKRAAGSIPELFRTKRMFTKTFSMSYQWIVCGLCFYGVSSYIGQISSDLFLVISLSAVFEILGTFLCVVMVNGLGRKASLFITNFGTGLAFILIPILPSAAAVPLACIALCGMAMAFSIVYVYTGEIYPTYIRNLGVGVASTVCRFGSMVAPFITGLGGAHPWVPPVTFGCVCIVGALLCFLLPETKGRKLPETLEDAENM